jgi:hypothetical protein
MNDWKNGWSVGGIPCGYAYGSLYDVFFSLNEITASYLLYNNIHDRKDAAPPLIPFMSPVTISSLDIPLGNSSYMNG